MRQTAALVRAINLRTIRKEKSTLYRSPQARNIVMTTRTPL